MFKWKCMKRCLFVFLYFKSFFPTSHLWEDFQYLFHPICLQLNLNSIQLILNSSQLQFKLHCNVVHASMSYSNELMCFISRTFKKILTPQGCLLFPYFSNDLNLDANKEDLWHVTNCKSYQFILWLKFIYIRLFQHFMSCHWHWKCVV
jgi:hypothetical protein